MMNTASSLLDDALQLLAEGFCVLPCWRVDKHPRYNWDKYKSKIITEAELVELFSKANYDAIVIVCGAVSGNLEVIDFDNKGELYQKWCDRIKRINPIILDRGVIETTQRGGYHFSYRVMGVCEGSKKIAMGIRPTIKEGKEVLGPMTLIETKGEGGLIVVAPSSGYKLINSEYAKIERFGTDERNMLIYHASGFNEIDSPVATKIKDSSIKYKSDMPTLGKHVVAWDDFNESGDLRELVEAHGWKYLYSTKDGNDHYMRPNQPDDGKSGATWNGSVFYVWSTSTSHFEANCGYNKSEVFSRLECGGDRDKAEERLLNLGYGDNTPISFDVEAFINNSLEKQKANEPFYDDQHELVTPDLKIDIIPDDLICFEGLINDVMEHTIKSAPYPNKIISFVGALAVVSFALCRKVKGFMGARPNLILLGLDYSAQGKDYPRKVNIEILTKTDQSNGLFSSMASAEGLEDKLFQNKKILLQNDEFDHLLNSVNDDRDTRHKAIMDLILKIHTSSDTIYPMRAKAGQESSLKINEPSLTIFGTAIPNLYYNALSEKMLNNGFFGRMLVFEGCGRQPMNEFAGNPVPNNIIDDFLAISKLDVDDGNLGNIKPIYIPPTEGAKKNIKDFAVIVERKIEEFRLLKDNGSITVWGRAVENVNKLSLIKSCQSKNLGGQMVTVDDVDWAIKLVIFLITQMTKNLNKKSDKTIDPVLLLNDKIINLISTQKNGMISRTLLQQRIRATSTNLDKSLDDLVSKRILRKDVCKVLSSKKSSIVYTYLQFHNSK